MDIEQLLSFTWLDSDSGMSNQHQFQADITGIPKCHVRIAIKILGNVVKDTVLNLNFVQWKFLLFDTSYFALGYLMLEAKLSCYEGKFSFGDSGIVLCSIAERYFLMEMDV